jgi:hypothetical protein
MDIYGLTIDGVVDLIDKHGQRFCRLLDNGVLGQGISWLKWKTEMRRRGKSSLVDEVCRIDNEYLNERLRNDVVEAYSRNDAETLKMAKEAIMALTGREKLVGEGSTGEDATMAMTINISGAKGKNEDH